MRWDEAGYQLIAKSLLAGKGYYEVVGARDLQQPPVVSYLSVAGRALGLPIPWSTALPAHVLLGSLVVVPVYLLGRDLKSRVIERDRGAAGGRPSGSRSQPAFLEHDDRAAVCPVHVVRDLRRLAGRS